MSLYADKNKDKIVSLMKTSNTSAINERTSGQRKAKLFLLSPRALTLQTKRSLVYEFTPQLVNEVAEKVGSHVVENLNLTLDNLKNTYAVASSIKPSSSGIPMDLAMFDYNWSYYLIIDNIPLKNSVIFSNTVVNNRLIIVGICSEDPFSDSGISGRAMNPSCIYSPTTYTYLSLDVGGGVTAVNRIENRDIYNNGTVKGLIYDGIKYDTKDNKYGVRDGAELENMKMLDSTTYILHDIDEMSAPTNPWESDERSIFGDVPTHMDYDEDDESGFGYDSYGHASINYDTANIGSKREADNEILDPSLNVPIYHTRKILFTGISAAKDLAVSRSPDRLRDATFPKFPSMSDTKDKFRSHFNALNRETYSTIFKDRAEIDPTKPISYGEIYNIFGTSLEITDLNVPKSPQFDVIDQRDITVGNVYSSMISVSLPAIMTKYRFSELALRYSTYTKPEEAHLHPNGIYEVMALGTFIHEDSDVIKERFHMYFMKTLYMDLLEIIKISIGDFDLWVSYQASGVTNIDLRPLDYSSSYNTGVSEYYNFVGGINTPMLGNNAVYSSNRQSFVALTDNIRDNFAR